MRRYQSLGIGILSTLFVGSMIGACSASGNDPGGTGTGAGANDSGAAGDTAYNYEAGPSENTYDAGPSTPFDSGPVVPFDAGPMYDCDLSGSGAIGYFTALESGGDGACNADDSCASASDCCMNIAALLGGGGSIPPAFAALFSGSTTPTCVPK
jgi:hypothetical protein